MSYNDSYSGRYKKRSMCSRQSSMGAVVYEVSMRVEGMTITIHRVRRNSN